GGERGEVPGPRMMIMGGGFVPVNGSPFYVLPARLPELPSPESATVLVEHLLDNPDVDGVKLFTGSWATQESIVVMPTNVVRAAVDAAHRRGKAVFAHPSNTAGGRGALAAGGGGPAPPLPPRPAWGRPPPPRIGAGNSGPL